MYIIRKYIHPCNLIQRRKGNVPSLQACSCTQTSSWTCPHPCPCCSFFSSGRSSGSSGWPSHSTLSSPAAPPGSISSYSLKISIHNKYKRFIREIRAGIFGIFGTSTENKVEFWFKILPISTYNRERCVFKTFNLAFFPIFHSPPPKKKWFYLFFT